MYSSASASVSPGNIWTPLWDSFASAGTDEQRTANIKAGEEAQVGGVLRVALCLLGLSAADMCVRVSVCPCVHLCPCVSVYKDSYLNLCTVIPV